MNTENNKEVKQEKPVKERIHTISHVMEILTKICIVAAKIGIVTIILTVLFLFLCGDMDLLICRGNVILHSPIQLGKEFGGINTWDSVFGLIGVMVKLIFVVMFLKQVKMIFADLQMDETPFQEKNVGRLRKIAIFYLVMSLVDVENAGGLEGVSIGFSMMSIIGAGMFWLISMIFEYGCELQTEHDETL